MEINDTSVWIPSLNFLNWVGWSSLILRDRPWLCSLEPSVCATVRRMPQIKNWISSRCVKDYWKEIKTKKEAGDCLSAMGKPKLKGYHDEMLVSGGRSGGGLAVVIWGQSAKRKKNHGKEKLASNFIRCDRLMGHFFKTNRERIKERNNCCRCSCHLTEPHLNWNSRLRRSAY